MTGADLGSGDIAVSKTRQGQDSVFREGTYAPEGIQLGPPKSQNLKVAESALNLGLLVSEAFYRLLLSNTGFKTSMFYLTVTLSLI